MMTTLLGKRRFDDTEERIAAAVGGVSLNLKKTRNDIAPNPCVVKEIGYQAMYARNLRLMSELGAANRMIIDLEDQLRRLKREYDELSGRHIMMIRETQGNPNDEMMVEPSQQTGPHQLCPGHARMYDNK
tara:strand:- start:9060 stop:9449 length:390 start_codon:yes stop_codon:yes gene_type:complete